MGCSEVSIVWKKRIGDIIQTIDFDIWQRIRAWSKSENELMKESRLINCGHNAWVAPALKNIELPSSPCIIFLINS